MWSKKFRTFFQLVGCLTVGVLAVYGLVMVFSGGSPAWAAIGQAIPHLQASPRVPNVLTYQGMLRQPDGTPLDGSYKMTFRLYDDPVAGSLRHTEVISPVVVREGLFTVLLGDTTAIDPAAFAGPLYIGVQVGTEPEMAPRQRIAPVAYAVQLTDGVYVDESGEVGIGTTDPQTQLDVNGDAVVGGNLSVNADITSSGAFTSGGDISWGGHLNNITVTIEYEASCWRWSGSTCYKDMAPKSNSICFLTLVNFEEGAKDKSTRVCEIIQEGDNWRLYAKSYIPGDPYMRHAFCKARCLQW